MNILVTGANGFVGRSLIRNLEAEGVHKVVGSTRNLSDSATGLSKIVAVGAISGTTDWTAALKDADVVIHLAGRAHVLNDGNGVAEFNRVNVDGTLRLAEQALKFGVKRFIFISSIGVNGSHTEGEPFNENSVVAPHAVYAESKKQAEELLKSRFNHTAMEVVIIRPPLVYASNAPGNFQRLLKLVASGLPLPFSLTCNKRSMVSLANLTDFISLCVKHPAAANETFLISDGIDLSTREIVTFLAEGMGAKVKLFPVPDNVVRIVLTALRKPTIYTQLFGSLVVDSNKARTLLNWTPVEDASQALIEAGSTFRLLRKKR